MNREMEWFWRWGSQVLFLCLAACVSAGEPSMTKSQASVPFALKNDVPIDSLAQTGTVDVNLGGSPEEFVRSVWKQLTGKEAASAAWVSAKAKLLGGKEAPRRIDLALLLAEEAGVRPAWAYSDPWVEQVDLRGSLPRKRRRSIGAVMMFFFTSPNPPNGSLGWANNHVSGMVAPAPVLSFGDTSTKASGMYHPHNPGFWYREFRDARYAGLDFLLLNVYGPDLADENMLPLLQAMERLGKEDGKEGIKLAMFDDTWTWGQPSQPPAWQVKPDCAKVEDASNLLYTAKWKPFFQRIPKEHWYLVKGRPFIYFYNANTLEHRENFDRVLTRMKERFKADFGVEPFVAVDAAFHISPNIERVSDQSFQWFPLDSPERCGTTKRRGVTLSHSMPRWDSTSRENGSKERKALPGDRLVKNDEILKLVLNETATADILVLATWNDLGEGTGFNRAYDYYWDGAWKTPDHFMNLIRRSQAGEKLK